MDARTWVASVRCRPRALSRPRAWQASSSLRSRRSSALPSSRRARNSHKAEWSKPGSVSSNPSRYFQSIRARTASAARRSGRSSRNCRMVTSARRHGGRAGWPSLGNRSAKSASAKMAPSSSRSLSRGLPLRKAARATRAVSSGTGWIGVGLRQPVSSRFERREAPGCRMRIGVVGCAIGPGLPEDADPGAREDADGVGVVAASGSGSAIDVGRPSGGVAGVVGEAGDGSPEAAIASPAEDHAAALAGLARDRSDAGLGGELVGSLEAFTDVAELGQDLGGADPAGAREGGDDRAIGKIGKRMLDTRGQLRDLGDQGLEHGGESADELAFGFGLGIAGATCGGGFEAPQQLAGRAPPAVAALGEEGLEALLAEPRGAAGRGIALQEGERDRAVDGREEGAGAGPEAVEQAPQLVRERDALRDQVVAAADQGAQGLDLARAGLERSEAMTVGAQQIAEEIAVALVALAAGRAIAGPRRLDHVGVDRHDRMARLDQGLDQQAGGPLDRHRQGRRRPELGEPALEFGQTGGRMRHLEPRRDRALRLVDDADRVPHAAPVDPYTMAHGSALPAGVGLIPAGRHRGSLIIRRSGSPPVAHQPVARRDLPAPATRRVSSGPTSGERHRPSWRAAGSGSLAPCGAGFQPAGWPNERIWGPL